MKTALTLFATIFSLHLLPAQQNAVTETGEAVVLYDNGTWTYINEQPTAAVDIAINPTPQTKSDDATFLVKSKKADYGIYLDPKTWSFSKAKNNLEAEYEMQIRDGDLYAMVIAEGVEIPMENLKDIAISNAKQAAPDLKLVNQEYRTVNDQRVLMLEMHGTMQGIKFAYLGYYTSNPSGSLQFVTYTSTGLIDKYREEAIELLNGLVQTSS